MAQAVKTGLIGYWPFNGNANDESVNHNNGSVTGATLTKDRFGNSNSAYQFDGNADYIDCGDSSNLFISTNTTNFWFLYQDTTKNQNFVNDVNSNSGEWGANYYHHANAGLIAGLNGGSNESWIAGVTKRNYRYSDSLWHMFTSSYSAKDNSLRFYIDGCFVSNIVSQYKGFVNGKDSLVHNGNEHWVFGARSQYLTTGTSSPGYLEGCLDDISLYNRVLTPQEIMELYVGRIYYDTTNVFDTIAVYDTTKITIYDTTNVFIYDTTFVTIFDTTNITILDTSYIVFNDTNIIVVNDTVEVIISDTSFVTVKTYDTTQIFHYDTIITRDTLFVAVTDTLYIKLEGSPNPSSCELRIYPNPTDHLLFIDSEQSCTLKGYQIRIVDDIGQLVYQTTISKNKYSVDLSKFVANGVYLVEISSPTGTVLKTKRIILY